MYSLLIAVAAGALTGLGLGFGGVCGIGWSITAGVATFLVVQVVVGRIVQKRVKAAMDAVQAVLVDGQKRLQAKVARWQMQMRSPGALQAAQAEMARDQKVFVREALERTEVLHKFDNWMPMMRRQIATAQFQLYWGIKEFKKVDELMPKALFFDPAMNAMKGIRSSKVSIQNHWKDSWLFSVGTDYRFNDEWTVRGGIAYEKSPVRDNYRLAIIPDLDRMWFTIGATWHVTKQLQGDFGFAWIHGIGNKSVYDNNNPSKEIGKFRKCESYLFGAQMVYKF